MKEIHTDRQTENGARRDLLAEASSATIYSELIETAPDAILTVDEAGRIVLVNQQAEALFGWPRERLLGQPIEMLVPEAARSRHRRHRDGYLQAPTPRSMGDERELHGLRADGSEFPVDISLSPLRTESGRWISCAVRDASERHRTEAHLRSLNRMYRLMSSVNTLILRTRSRKELFEQACRVAVEQGGFRMAWIGLVMGTELQPAAVWGNGKGYLQQQRISIRSDDSNGQGPAGRAVRGKCPCIVNDIAADPIMLPWREQALAQGFGAAAAFPLLVNGEVVGMLGLYAEATGIFDAEEVRLLGKLADDIAFAMEAIAREEKLDYLAYYDPVTRLANRALFTERLGRYLEGSRESNERLVVLVLDIERFRSVNASLGVISGDELLQQMALRLADIAGDVSQVARIDSNAFALLLPHLANDSDELLQQLQDRVWATLDRPFAVAGEPLHMTVRIGLARFPEDALSAGRLLHNAEAAMKNAKLSGERLQFYTARMSQALDEKLRLEHSLRLALEQNEFEMHYQPKLRLGDGCICGAEALLRWRRSNGDMVLPSRFIPLLEETGLIVEVGQWTMQRVAADMARWRAEGLKVPVIGINVSALQLRQPDFLQQLRSLTLELASGDGGGGLELEITESMLMSRLEESAEALRQLHELGLRIAIDDFGTGYSSLAYLRQLPVDTVKIDQSFVRDLGSGSEAEIMVAGIISLARSLHLQVVAEGVQTAEQARLLAELGCDAIQGHLFHPALPPGGLAELLRHPPRFALPAAAARTGTWGHGQ